jgi:hypothetical protein
MLKQKNIAMSLQTADRRKGARSSDGTVAFMLTTDDKLSQSSSRTTASDLERPGDLGLMLEAVARVSCATFARALTAVNPVVCLWGRVV